MRKKKKDNFDLHYIASDISSNIKNHLLFPAISPYLMNQTN